MAENSLTLFPTLPAAWTIMRGPQAGQPTPEFYRFIALAFAGGAAPFSLAELEQYLFAQPTVSPADVQNLQSATATLRALALMHPAYGAQIDALQTAVDTLQALVVMSGLHQPRASSATPSTLPGATYSGPQTAPTGPNSTTLITMQGMAGSITPQTTGNVLINVSGTFLSSAALVDQGMTARLYYGTGTAPTNNAAVTGTPSGATVRWSNPVAPVAAADVNVPFSVSTVVSGLALGTAYWLDVGARAITTASVFNLSAAISAIEC